MEYLSDEEARALLEAARVAAQHTYSPYSEFVVGAVVKTADGKVYGGTNIENASYGLTICAERIAIGHAISQTSSPIVAVAVWTPKDTASPCGACRQFILEFGAEILVLFNYHGQILQKTAAELLPYGFTSKALE